MGKINCAVSLIGVDRYLTVPALVDAVDAKGVEVEVGVLYSTSKAGRHNRYPPLSFVSSFPDMDVIKSSSLKLSLHLCGEVVSDFILNWSKYSELVYKYNRVQLNFTVAQPERHTSTYIANLIHKAAVSLRVPIVLQYEESKSYIFEELGRLGGVDNYIHLLFDASKGTGKEIDVIHPVIPGIYCGYAGGIGPENAFDVTRKIIEVNEPNTAFYIDMESKIRDSEDWLDAEKCAKVVAEVKRAYGQ